MGIKSTFRSRITSTASRTISIMPQIYQYDTPGVLTRPVQTTQSIPSYSIPSTCTASTSPIPQLGIQLPRYHLRCVASRRSDNGYAPESHDHTEESSGDPLRLGLDLHLGR
jgi:hypothetical protein